MEDIYQTELLALARSIRNLKALETPTHTVELNNPVCGDNVVISVILENRHISAHHIKADGCALCAAGAGLWHKLTHNDNAHELHNNKALIEAYLTGNLPADGAKAIVLKPFEPVIAFKNRHKCVLLSFQAAAQLADEI